MTRPHMQAKTAPLLLGLVCSYIALTAAQINVQVFSNIREGKFQGQEFTRLCSISGTTQSVFFEWLRDGVVVHSGSGDDQSLRLTIPSVDLTDAGSYECRVTLDDSSVIGPVSAGSLIVLDNGLINAPPEQYVQHQQSSRINCSFPGAISTLRKNGTIVSPNLDSPSFNVEGVYHCNLFYQDADLQIQVGIDLEIFLHVFVPVDILNHPPAYQSLIGNPPLTLRVAFSGRQAQNMSITWFRNGGELPTSLINTTYSPSQLSGTTELKFAAVTRRDKGVYRVVIASEVGYDVYPRSDTQEEVSFQVDVTVPPSAPTDFATDGLVHRSTAFFKWSNTNQNADEGADTFNLQITFENGTLFQNEMFAGGVSDRNVVGLIPGTNFSALLVAENVDGEAETGPIWFHTDNGNPMVNHVSVTRINISDFTAHVSLAYTGGGRIDIIRVHTTNSENNNEQRFDILATQSPDSDLVWNADFSITDPRFAPEGRFSVRVSAINEHFFESEGILVPVPAYSTTEPPTSVPTSGPPDTMWLILLAVVAGTVIITIIIVTLCLVTVCYCKRSKKYSVNSSPADQSTEEKQLPEDHPTITRGANTDDNLAKVTISLGSIPSIQLPDHSPDNRYIDSEQIMKKGHRRYPSDASSKASSNRSHPVSTASNSPNTMQMIKYQNERNVFAEGSTASLTNDFESRSQLSQTESEALSKPGHLHSYSQVGFTNSTCSSPHSSQQSIPMYAHRHGSQPFDHHHHPSHRRNYSLTSSISGIKEEDGASLTPSTLSQHYRPQPYQNHQLSLSISSTEMDTRPPSESVCTCSVTTGGEMSPEYVCMQPATDPVQVSIV